MKAETFLEQFGHLAEAPNDIPRLRELILQLAVRGKLVPQDPNDEPASELIKKIQAERQRLIAEGIIRKLKPLPPIDQEAIPDALPPGWTCVRMGEVLQKMGAGSTPRGGKSVYTEDGIAFIRSQNVYNDGLRLTGVARIPHDVHAQMSGTHVQPRDILLNITGASIARSAVVPDDFDEANVNQHVAILRPVISDVRAFLHTWIVSPEGYSSIMGVQVGISREGLSMYRLRDFVVPLAPLAEQKRIVAKVDELMALCDELEAKQQAVRTKRIALNRASLHALTEPDGTSLAAAWHRVRDHFDHLYTVPETVGELRQTILQLAVMGRLVPQDPNDEAASELLKRIQAEKARLIAEGVIRKPKPSPAISEGALPFELPATWAWTCFDGVATIASNLVSPSEYRTLQHIAPNHIEKATGRLLEHRTVAEDKVTSSKHRFFSGQILYSKIRPNLNKLTVVDFDGLCSADMYPIDSHIDTEYLARYMLSGSFLSFAVLSDTRVAMPKINQERLREVPVAVPPLTEQKRIVAKVDQLMTLCDELEAKLHQSQTDADNLLTAIVHELVTAEGGHRLVTPEETKGEKT